LSRPPSKLPAVAFLLVLAVLFAPNTESQPANATGFADETVGALMLAPTVREGMQAGPKLSARQDPGADQRSWPGTILASVLSVAAVLLVAFLTWLARRESPDVPRDVALRALVPRGPPAYHTA
jgi:hypothetical protein